METAVKLSLADMQKVLTRATKREEGLVLKSDKVGIHYLTCPATDILNKDSNPTVRWEGTTLNIFAGGKIYTPASQQSQEMFMAYLETAMVSETIQGQPKNYFNRTI